MAQEEYKMSGILALANTPNSGTSMRDWCPFAGGHSLNVILKNRNDKSIEIMKKVGWDPDKIARSGLIYDVDPLGLSKLDQLGLDILMDIRILLIDLEAFVEEKEAKRWEKFRAPQISHESSHWQA